MTKKCRVLFQRPSGDEGAFKSQMIRLGVNTETLDKIVGKAPLILAQGLTLGAARRYADAIQLAGGKVTIQEHGWFEETRRMSRGISVAPFENFTMCPRCGFKQPKGEKCVKCASKLGPGDGGKGQGDVTGH